MTGDEPTNKKTCPTCGINPDYWVERFFALQAALDRLEWTIARAGRLSGAGLPEYLSGTSVAVQPFRVSLEEPQKLVEKGQPSDSPEGDPVH